MKYYNSISRIPFHDSDSSIPVQIKIESDSQKIQHHPRHFLQQVD